MLRPVLSTGCTKHILHMQVPAGIYPLGLLYTKSCTTCQTISAKLLQLSSHIIVNLTLTVLGGVHVHTFSMHRYVEIA